VTIGTVFKKEMEKACEKAVMNIRNADVTLDKVSAFELKLSLKESIKNIRESIGHSCEKIREKITTDMVFGSFLEGLQDGLDQDLEENLETCEIKIWQEIDSKVINTV